MGRACTTYRREGFGGNLRERDYFEDTSVDGRITLR
jgi:hypothetical protein